MVTKAIIKCPRCGEECNCFESTQCKYCGMGLNPGDFE